MSLTPERNVYTVTRLNREVRLLLERGLTVIWVEAELSNFSQPASGHWYFHAQGQGSPNPRGDVPPAQYDARVYAQIRAARGGAWPGQPVRARGDYQMIVEHMEEAGVGALKREFERLKARLAAEGLFAPELKRPLPTFPRRIGVITSPSGAAIRDIVHILNRRYPPARVLIYPPPCRARRRCPP